MTKLQEKLSELFAQDFALPIAQFMATALYDPTNGYYTGRAALGSKGDFITSPEISPIFCALVSEWAVKTALQSQDHNQPLRFVELGPGRGKLAAGLSFACKNAGLDCDITLVECDPGLKKIQHSLMQKTSAKVTWVEDTSMIESGPAVVIANEFVDCLPIRQFVMNKGQWHERVVIKDPNDQLRLAYGLGKTVPKMLIPEQLRDAQEGDLVETRDLVEVMLSNLAARLGEFPATLLFIDYGTFESVYGDTLQAVKSHEKVDPLSSLGEADITASVDFAQLEHFSKKWAFNAFGATTQREGLERMGLDQLIDDMRDSLDKPQFERLMKGVDRIADQREMGHLFKMLILTTQHTPAPPDFEDLGNG